MKSRWQCVYLLFALVAFILPIEHKYDKPLRLFSKSLIPEGLSLPSWFEKKVYFYPSDLAALLLILLAVFLLKVPLRKILFHGQVRLLWLLIAVIGISISASSLSHYALFYFRLWQWVTGALLFGLLAAMDPTERNTTAKWILGSIIAMGALQSILAILQYAHQGSFGLHFLGEPRFHPSLPNSPAIICEHGHRWIFDTWLKIDANTPIIVRSPGTTSHPNVLGGFLALTGLASLSFAAHSQRIWLWRGLIFLQLFALAITYSRGALFSYLIGVAIWFGWSAIVQKQKGLWKTVLFIGATCLCILFVFKDQLATRGGVFNESKLSQQSDAYRANLENIAWNVISRHPCLGLGLHQFSLRAPEFATTKQPSDFIHSPHNIYLLLAAEAGVFALLSFLAFIISILKRALQNDASLYVGSLLAMFCALLIIGIRDFYPLFFQIGKLLFFMTAGLLATQPRVTSFPSQL